MGQTWGTLLWYPLVIVAALFCQDQQDNPFYHRYDGHTPYHQTHCLEHNEGEIYLHGQKVFENGNCL